MDLEVNSDLKASLRELHITAAKEVGKAATCRRPLIQCGVPQLGHMQSGSTVKLSTSVLILQTARRLLVHFIFAIYKRHIAAAPKPMLYGSDS